MVLWPAIAGESSGSGRSSIEKRTHEKPGRPVKPLTAEEKQQRPEKLDELEKRNWPSLLSTLDGQGNVVLPGVLIKEKYRLLAGLYPDDQNFRSRVVMARHGFGRGEYKYFAYPSPEIIAGLRRELYRKLAPLANRWN